VQEDFHKSNGSPFPLKGRAGKGAGEKNRQQGAGGVEKLGRRYIQTVLLNNPPLPLYSLLPVLPLLLLRIFWIICIPDTACQ